MTWHRRMQRSAEATWSTIKGGDPPWPSGYDTSAPTHEFAGLSLRWISKQVGLVAYKCAALCRSVYGSSATKRSLATIHEEKGIFSQFGVSISSRYDLSC